MRAGGAGGVVLVLLPIVAFSPSADAGDAFATPGWVLLRYIAGSGESIIRVTADFHGPGVMSVDKRFDVGGASWGRAKWSGGQLEVTAQDSDVQVAAFPFGISLKNRLTASETGLVLVWAMSRSDPWSWEAELAPGASLTLVDSGEGGLFSLGEDSNEGLHAHASAFYAAATLSDATYSVDVSHNFVGYAGLGTQTEDDIIEVEFPDGATESCPCTAPFFRDWLEGTYTLRWSASRVGEQRMLIVGVDVEGFRGIYE